MDDKILKTEKQLSYLNGQIDMAFALSIEADGKRTINGAPYSDVVAGLIKERDAAQSELNTLQQQQ